MQRLRVLGGISIEVDDGPLTGRAVQRRRLALLALLASARAGGGSSSGMSRDRLVALLWPDADAENGRRYLSDSAYRINQALGEEAITAAGDELLLDVKQLPCDLVEFREALARHDHEAAAALYTGPFLDGFNLPDAPDMERWAESERASIAAEFGRVLEALGEAAAQRGDRTAAASWFRRLASHDPYNARVALRFMEALRDAGDRVAAIQHARVHAELVKQELELDADPAVAALADRLRGELADAPAAAPPIKGQDVVPALAIPAQAADLPLAALVADQPLAAPAERPAESAPRPRRLARAITVSVVLVGATAAVLTARGPLMTGADARPVVRSVAVLPFVNLSPERDNEYFSDGMTDELIATLGNVEGVEVASRTSVFAYKNQALDVREIGRRLGVDAVVEGSVRRSGNALRITAQLVSAENGYRLWSDAFDREVKDAFAIQEEISRAIVSRISGSLALTQAGSARASAPDAEAYDLYLRGRFAWHQRTREGLRRAVDYFGRAVQRAPNYARAYVGLGDAHAVSAFYDYSAPRDAYPQAEAAARKALELEPGLAAAHATLGYVFTYYHLDWPRAEVEFRRAIAIDPNHSTAHQWYGNLLTVAGRFDEAARELRLAQEADPLSLIANAALGWSFFMAGQFDEAVEQCRKTLALNPDYELAHLWGGLALEALDRRDEARQWIGRAVELSRGSDLTRLALAHLLAGSAPGRDSARAILRDVESAARRGAYVPAYEIAKVHLALGDRALALRWLERAVEARSHSRAYLRVDPQWAPLRGDIAFDELAIRAFGNN